MSNPRCHLVCGGVTLGPPSSLSCRRQCKPKAQKFVGRLEWECCFTMNIILVSLVPYWRVRRNTISSSVSDFLSVSTGTASGSTLPRLRSRWPLPWFCFASRWPQTPPGLLPSHTRLSSNPIMGSTCTWKKFPNIRAHGTMIIYVLF